MTVLRKHALIGIAAFGLASLSSSLVLAQSPAPARDDTHHEHEHPSPEKMAEHAARRQAALHDALKLTPQQESAWTTYTAKLRAGQPMQRPDHAQMEKMPTPERMEKMLAMMREGERRMADRLEATKPFYAALTPAQRAIFDKETGGKHHHGEHDGPPGQRHDDK